MDRSSSDDIATYVDVLPVLWVIAEFLNASVFVAGGRLNSHKNYVTYIRTGFAAFAKVTKSDQ